MTRADQRIKWEKTITHNHVACCSSVPLVARAVVEADAVSVARAHIREVQRSAKTSHVAVIVEEASRVPFLALTDVRASTDSVTVADIGVAGRISKAWSDLTLRAFVHRIAVAGVWSDTVTVSTARARTFFTNPSKAHRITNRQ